SHRISQARELYRAFAAGDRSTVENLLAPSFSFSSPLDVGLDRSGFFERCWPGSGQGQSVEFVRLLEVGDTVVVTYERTGQDGRRGRNTEVLTFEGDQIGAAEVYFGWSL
ncbi:MAG: nuclear transport factor 2 family protein, partial [Solirubrobacterales bacterium]|nr:nuclear transport factor 2 family protein [Solirubrobacterales bacterium]